MLSSSLTTSAGKLLRRCCVADGFAYKATAAASTLAQSKPSLVSDNLPTIRELRDTIALHAKKVYNGPKVEFDPKRAHYRTVGALTAIIPVASRYDESWRAYFHNKKFCRFGVVLEELDVLATCIGYKHNQDPDIPLGIPAHHSMSVVTSRVDKIGLFLYTTRQLKYAQFNVKNFLREIILDVVPNAQFRSDQDIILSGYLSWLGNSSMEITMHVQQEDPQSINNLRDLLTAKFIMVTIAPDMSAGAPNVRLIVNNDNERKDFEAGECAKNQRVQRDKTSMAISPPTADEDSLLRSIILPTLNPLSYSDTHTKLSVDQVWMSKTKADTIMICYPEQTNLQGYIFGGYLLREAYDIAWANVSQFAKQSPTCIGVTDALLSKPVPVNSLLHYNSQICYTDGRFAEVAVSTVIEDISKNKFETNNTFNFTFDAHENLPKLVPRTYSVDETLIPTS